MRRVVITGTGMVSPLGCGTEITWSRLLEGRSGAARVTAFEVEDLPAKIACSIPLGDGSDGKNDNRTDTEALDRTVSVIGGAIDAWESFLPGPLAPDPRPYKPRPLPPGPKKPQGRRSLRLFRPTSIPGRPSGGSRGSRRSWR